jgi:nicotinamidase-related amidase
MYEGGTIIATRDYHPRDHCSFTTQGGPFPCHCIQGTNGSFLHENIVTALQPLLADDEKSKRTHVVYKAFTKDIDSFGAFQYTDDTFHPHTLVRGSSEEATKSETENINKNDQSTEDENDQFLKGDGWERRLSHNTDHCSLEWTGGYTLYSSNLMEDANAPPDVMSIFEKRPLGDLLPKITSKIGDDDKNDNDNNGNSIGRLFVCGLAYDYCVIDSTVNFCRYKEKNNITTGGKCFIIQDLTRAAHIPGVGQFGSGFLTDPKIMYDKLQKNNIELMQFE